MTYRIEKKEETVLITFIEEEREYPLEIPNDEGIEKWIEKSKIGLFKEAKIIAQPPIENSIMDYLLEIDMKLVLLELGISEEV